MKISRNELNEKLNLHGKTVVLIPNFICNKCFTLLFATVKHPYESKANPETSDDFEGIELQGCKHIDGD